MSARFSNFPWLLILLTVVLAGCGTLGGGPETPSPTDEAPADGSQPAVEGALEAPVAVVDPAVQSRFDEAIALMQGAQYEQAVVLLEQLADSQPDLAGPRVNLGIAYARLERTEEAYRALGEVLKLQPTHPAANNQLGMLYRAEGRFDEAQSAYQKILTAHPEYEYAHFNMGILCDLYLRDMECALRHYERYQELSGEEDKKVAVWIADLRKRLGTPAAAAETGAE